MVGVILENMWSALIDRYDKDVSALLGFRYDNGDLNLKRVQIVETMKIFTGKIWGEMRMKL